MTMARILAAWMLISIYICSRIQCQQMYNMATQLCCDGELHVKRNGSLRYACCGKEAYERRSEICCENTIHPLIKNVTASCCGDRLIISDPDKDAKSRLRLDCCGNEEYDTEEFKCCHGVLNEIGVHQREHLRCCGHKMYDDETQVCWSDPRDYYLDIKFWNISNTRILNKTVLDDGSMSYTTDYCGNQIYDKNNETCCGEVLHPLVSEQGCCGTNVIDRNTQVCCRDNVIETLGEYQYCCGDSTFNYSTQLCCDDKVVEPKLNSQCCGNSTINFVTQFCCAGTVFSLIDIYKDKLDACCVPGYIPVYMRSPSRAQALLAECMYRYTGVGVTNYPLS